MAVDDDIQSQVYVYVYQEVTCLLILNIAHQCAFKIDVQYQYMYIPCMYAHMLKLHMTVLCMIRNMYCYQYSDYYLQFVSEAFQPRTRETHALQCLSLGDVLHDHFATTFGINRDSILNESKYFHVTEGLVPDVMHDILEGALPLEVKELLRVFVSLKYFSISTLNKVIESFPYSGHDVFNKPTPIISSTTLSSQDHLLKQSGKLCEYYCAYTCIIMLYLAYFHLFTWI